MTLLGKVNRNLDERNQNSKVLGVGCRGQVVGEVIQTAGSEAAVFLLLFRNYKGTTAGILSQLRLRRDLGFEVSYFPPGLVAQLVRARP